jgi:hypothetical protein
MNINRRNHDELTRKIMPHLAGQDPELVGGVLADLLAIFLAGHVVVGSKPETDKLREDVLAIHLEAVRQLVTINAELMGTTGEEDD